MRILDLLLPHLSGVERIVDVYRGPIRLRSYLQLPDGVGYQRVKAEEFDSLELRPSDVVLSLFGPVPTTHDDLAELPSMIGRTVLGMRHAVLLGWPPQEVPFHRLLDPVVEASLQVLTAVPLTYERIRCGVVARRVECLQPPRGYFGEGGEDSDFDRTRATLRLAGEHVLSTLVSRSVRSQAEEAKAARAREVDLRERYADLDDELTRARQQERVLSQRVTELEDAVEALREERADLQSDVEEVLASTTWKLGKALAEAAQHPASKGLRLPRRLWQLWRRRGAWQGERRRHSSSTSAAAEVGDETWRLRAYRSSRRGHAVIPRVALVTRERTALAFSADCEVTRLLPHDAVARLDAEQPDLLLIESAVSRPGHAWATLGRPGAAERDRQLYELVNAAKRWEIPVVHWSNTLVGEAPSLRRILAGASLHLRDTADSGDAWSPGVQPNRFNPLGADPGRPMMPLHVRIGMDGRSEGERQRAAEVLRAARKMGLREHVDIGSSGAQGRGPDDEILTDECAPAVFRSVGLFIASTLGGPTSRGEEDRSLEQIACGGRVVIGSNPMLQEEFPPDIVTIGPRDDPSEVLRAAMSLPARGVTEALPALRTIFERHATRVMLSRLCVELGLDVEPASMRRVAVLVRTGEEDLAEDALVASMLAQKLPVSRLVVSRKDAPERRGRALDELEDAGIQVEVVSVDAGPGWFDEAISRVDEPWITVWDPQRRYGSEFLRDRVMAWEWTRSDLVGTGSSPWRASADLDPHGTLVPREAMACKQSAGLTYQERFHGLLRSAASTFSVAERS